MASPARIQAVDDDPHVLDTVVTALEKLGFTVETSTNGRDAYRRALEAPPDLLITDIMMPELDGWQLVQSLRLQPQLALVPVVFLTGLGSRDDRIKGFRLGADQYIAKPFDVVELGERVTAALERSKAIQRSVAHLSGDRPSDAAVRGDLSQIGAASMLQLLELDRRSGLFEVQREGRHARVELRNGQVIRARFLAEPGTAVNAECVYEIVGWSEGRFELHVGELDCGDELGMSTSQLLLEGARRLDRRRLET